MIKKRKTAYLGHIMCNTKYELLQRIIQEKIEGRRGVRRKKLSWLCNIRQWTELRTVEELIYTARNREKMQNVITNHPLNKHTKKKTHIQDVQRNDPHDFLDTSNN